MSKLFRLSNGMSEVIFLLALVSHLVAFVRSETSACPSADSTQTNLSLSSSNMVDCQTGANLCPRL